MRKNFKTVIGATLATAMIFTGCASSSSGNKTESSTAEQKTEAEKKTEADGTTKDAGADTTAAPTDSTEAPTEKAEDTTEAPAEKKVVVAVTHASPRPFTYYDDDNNLTGQNVELINAIFEKLPEYELKWEVSPDFPAIFAGLDSDKYQIGVNNLSWNEERGEKYLFTAPMFKNELIVVTNAGLELADVINYEDLVGKTYIGSPTITYTAWIEQFNETSDEDIIIEYNESDIALQLNLISENENYFTVIDAPMYFGYYQPTFGYELPTSVLESGSGDDFYSYFIVSKGNDKLAADINKALLEVTENGTAKEISEKYLGGDYAPSADEIKKYSE